MLEGAINDLESAAGIIPLGDYSLIDERKQGYVTYRLEVRFERLGEQCHVRIRVTDWKNSGRTGTSGHSFAWPVSDPKNPTELTSILDRIIQAGEPGAEIHDERGRVARTFDRLLGLRQVNSIPVLGEIPGPPRHVLSARIIREKFGLQVILCHQVKGRSPTSAFVPMESLVALRARYN